MNDPMRATAERLARESDADVEQFREIIAPASMTTWADLRESDKQRYREAFAFARGLTHRDRTAEREAASKAWDAALAWCGVVIVHGIPARDRYLAAEFDAGERVTLSDGSVVAVDGHMLRRRYTDGKGSCGTHMASWTCIIAPTDTGSDFDAVKRLAEQREAER